jgi:hypothetical protein
LPVQPGSVFLRAARRHETAINARALREILIELKQQGAGRNGKSPVRERAARRSRATWIHGSDGRRVVLGHQPRIARASSPRLRPTAAERTERGGGAAHGPRSTRAAVDVLTDAADCDRGADRSLREC